MDADKLIGREFAGVTLLSVHGRGHSGVVFVGFQKSLKRKVAVKLVPKANLSARSFMDEAEVVAVLNHPNIVTVFDVGDDDEYLFITMQLVDGSSLQSMVERSAKNPIPSKRRMPVTKVLRIIASVLGAWSTPTGRASCIRTSSRATYSSSPRVTGRFWWISG